MAQMLLFGLTVLIMAQEPLRVEVALVTVGVRVTDREGRAIGGLKAGDFVLYENGVRQEIVFSPAKNCPSVLPFSSTGATAWRRAASCNARRTPLVTS